MDDREHATQAADLLGLVSHPLISGNPQLESEVLWGAATQMVKAVAKAHNLRNSTHRDLFRAVGLIGTTIANDVNLLPEFGRISELHINFYDGEMDAAEIAERSAIVFVFTDKMQRILDSAT